MEAVLKALRDPVGCVQSLVLREATPAALLIIALNLAASSLCAAFFTGNSVYADQAELNRVITVLFFYYLALAITSIPLLHIISNHLFKSGLGIKKTACLIGFSNLCNLSGYLLYMVLFPFPVPSPHLLLALSGHGGKLLLIYSYFVTADGSASKKLYSLVCFYLANQLLIFTANQLFGQSLLPL